MSGLKVSRRDFMKGVAAVGTAAFLGKYCSDTQLLKPATAADVQEQDEEKLVYTTCKICSAACGLVARVKNGVLVEIEGNPLDQHSKGRICGKGAAFKQIAYNPDRIKTLLIRTNPEKGIGVDPKFRKADWDEVFELIAKKMYEAMQEHGPKSIVTIGQHKYNNLLKAIGSPNYFCHHSTCDSTTFPVQKAIVGKSKLVYDLTNAKYIISIGWNYVGSAKNPMAQAFMEAKKKGAKIVVFDPVYTVAASKADEYYPIRPGTDLALVLAMINVIINKGLYDAEFVEKYCYGFDKVAEFIKPYTPEWAAEITGVPAEAIERIAVEFATTKPACIPMWKRHGPGPMRFIGGRLAHAMLILQAITGNVEVEGGMFLPRKKLAKVKAEEKPPEPDGEPLDGSSKFPLWDLYNGKCRGLYQALPTALQKADYVKVVFFTGQNILSIPGYRTMCEALKDKFVVVVTTVPDETCYFADVVLPDAVSGLENTGVVERGFSPFPQVSVIQKVIKSPVKYSASKSMIEIAKRLGELMGVDLLKRIPQKDLDKMLEPYGITYEELKKIGVYSTTGKFEPKLKFKTPTGKIELYSTKLEKYGYDPLPYWRDDANYVKFYLGGLGKDEFFFTTVRNPLRRNYKQNNLPWIVEAEPYNTVWINASRAAELGIRDGDKVVVQLVRDPFRKYSNGPKVVGYARVTETISPNVIAIPYGYGKWSKMLSVADARGIIVNDLTVARTTEEMLELNEPFAPSGDADMIVKVMKA